MAAVNKQYTTTCEQLIKGKKVTGRNQVPRQGLEAAHDGGGLRDGGETVKGPDQCQDRLRELHSHWGKGGRGEEGRCGRLRWGTRAIVGQPQ